MSKLITYTKTVGVSDAALTIDGTSFTLASTTASVSGTAITITDGVETVIGASQDFRGNGGSGFITEEDVVTYINLLKETPNLYTPQAVVNFVGDSSNNLTIGDTGVTVTTGGATFAAAYTATTGMSYKTVRIDVTGGEIFIGFSPVLCKVNGSTVTSDVEVFASVLTAANSIYLTAPEEVDGIGGVSIYNPAVGDLFQYDGTNWVNTSASATFEVYDYYFVAAKSDLPDSVANVITLEANSTYFFTGTVDLEGCRLVASDNTVILGPSSENARITSTGLGTGVALLTTDYTLPCRHVTFQDVDTAIQVNGTANAPVALDWTGVNFENVPNVGEIDTCDNFIYSKGAFLNSKGLNCTGTIGTLGFDNSIFVADGAAGTLITLDASCTITRRFRIIYSSVVAFGSTAGIDVNASATVPTESFILDTINFSGGSTYLSDVDDTSNTSLFRFCKGITNTTVNGNLYMTDNITATTVSASDTFYKVAGTTTNGLNNKFTGTDNRLTCNATIPRRFQVIVTLTYTTGSNNVCEFAIYDSAISDYCTASRTHSTANSGGRAENITLMCLMELEDTEYIEVHASNTSGTTDITVEDLNVTIIEI